MTAPHLTGHQQAQLRKLWELGAISIETSRSVYDRGAEALNPTTVAGSLVKLGLTRAKLRMRDDRSMRCSHYWLTTAGLEHVERTARPVTRRGEAYLDA